MARRDGLSSSLFPFMSVLACTIGALVVLLAILSLSAVETSAAARSVDDEERARQRSARAALDAEARLLAEAEARWAALDEALERRGLEAGQDGFALSRWIDRERRVEATREAMRALERERERLDAERGEVQTSIEVLASRRETLPILIDPTGLSQRWQPFFIECDAGGATLYRARDGFRYFVPSASIEMAGDFARYLRRVRAEPGALLVLLVRSDGLVTARDVGAVAQGAGIRVAKLPLPGDGPLDWSLLVRAEGAGPSPAEDRR